MITRYTHCYRWLALGLVVLIGLAALPAGATPRGVAPAAADEPGARSSVSGGPLAERQGPAGSDSAPALTLASAGEEWEPFFLQQDPPMRLAVNDGTSIYALGLFQYGLRQEVLGRWEPTSRAWTIVPGPDGAPLVDVRALAVDGRRLYVGGGFNINGSRALVLNTTSGQWSQLGTNLCCTVEAMAAAGSELYALGSFGLTQWDSAQQSWVVLAAVGPGGLSPSPPGVPTTMTITADSIYLGSIFVGQSGLFSITRWDKAARTAEVIGPSQMIGAIEGIVPYQGELYVVGSRLTRWNRATNSFDSLAMLDNRGTGAVLLDQSIYMTTDLTVKRYDLGTGQLITLDVPSHGGGITAMNGKVYASVMRPTSVYNSSNTGVSAWDPATATWDHLQHGIRGVDRSVRAFAARGC
ncbi:MAG: hypothetical protein AB4911_17260 [Oscillochloridaceae bacterium umkhey_bin13]